MHHPRTNVVLIGMPGAGKSTVGVVLAKRLGRGFVDTDLLLQQRAGKSLQRIIDEDGQQAFRRLEEQILCAFAGRDCVVATGGSAIYSEMAMRHLAANGIIVFLDVPLAELQQRLHDMQNRGLVIGPGAGLADLYSERLPLYRCWADITIDGRGKNLEEVVDAIVRALQRDKKTAGT